MIGLFFVLFYNNDIPKKEKFSLIGVLLVLDVILYFLVPSDYLKFLSNCLLITGLVAAQNTIVCALHFEIAFALIMIG